MTKIVPPQEPDPTTRQELHHLRLNELATVGISLSLLIEKQCNRLAMDESAQTFAKLAPALAGAFAKVARSVRQTIAIDVKLRKDAARTSNVADTSAEADRATSRQIVRRIAGAIDHKATPSDRESLLADLYERLDDPEIDELLATTDFDTFIDQTIRDVGVDTASNARAPGTEQASQWPCPQARSAPFAPAAAPPSGEFGCSGRSPDLP